MAKPEETKERIYNLPENFIEGGRIFNGMFKLRNFIEALVLALAFAFVALLLPIKSTYVRITVVLLFALPPFFFGITGINGDPVFTFLRNAWRWKKTHGVMVYDYRIKTLSKSPLDAAMEEPLAADKIAGFVDKWHEKKRTKEELRRVNTVFEFEDDTEITRVKGAEKNNASKHKHSRKSNASTAPEFHDYTVPLSSEDDDNFTLDIDFD